MKAVQLIQPGQPLELREIPVPDLGPLDVLVRVKAAGICHSDVHYRSGHSRAYPLPLTLGHEVAGVVEAVGAAVTTRQIGDRVCLHYLTTCGACLYCHKGTEQFCPSGEMLGMYRDGGYAEYIRVPARNAFLLPDEIPFEHGAVMMCSSSTSLHALNKSRLKASESVAIFGIGGLGISAVQLAQALGAGTVYAVDIKPGKLEMAARFGAIPINAQETDPIDELMRLTNNQGVDVALELVGLPLTMQQAVRSLAKGGRLAIAGISHKTFEVAPYKELIGKEAEIIGVSDHLAQEIPQLLDWARQGKLDLSEVITRTVPLDAGAINHTLDQLEQFSDAVRVVITP